MNRRTMVIELCAAGIPPKQFIIELDGKSESQVMAEYAAIIEPYPEDVQWAITLVEALELPPVQESPNATRH